MARKHNTCNHSVSQLNCPSLALPDRHQICSLIRSFIVERRDSTFQLIKEPFECFY